MKNSVAECKTVDEQKQVVLISTPVVTQDRFAELTGLTVGQVRGMVEKGHLPSIKLGNAKPRFVNVALINKAAMDQEDWL